MCRIWWWGVLLLTWLIWLTWGTATHAAPVEGLIDLTGQAVPMVTPDARDIPEGGGELFTGGALSSREHVRYLVRVKNQTGDPIEAGSLLLVVDKILDRTRGQDVSDQLEILNADGYTKTGKPYFRVPVGGADVLAPFAESETLVLEIRNPNLLLLSGPTFLVRGVQLTAHRKIQELKDALIEQGVLSEEPPKPGSP